MSLNGIFSQSTTHQLEREENIPNIKTLSNPKLLELLDRQNHLIKSPALLKLPDKGKKVNELKAEIVKELEKRNNPEVISEKLAKLSLDEKKVDNLEWGASGDCKLKHCSTKDETNPIAILATHSGTNLNKQIIKIEESDKPLVTLEDIEDAYALDLCNRIDKTEPTSRFLPHRSLNSSKTSIKEIKPRDLSAATPPPPVFGDAKLITLEESIKLQYEQTQHLKEVQFKHATTRLKEMYGKMGKTLPSITSTNNYREPPVYNEDNSDGEDSNESNDDS